MRHAIVWSCLFLILGCSNNPSTPPTWTGEVLLACGRWSGDSRPNATRMIADVALYPDSSVSVSHRQIQFLLSYGCDLLHTFQVPLVRVEANIDSIEALELSNEVDFVKGVENPESLVVNSVIVGYSHSIVQADIDSLEAAGAVIESVDRWFALISLEDSAIPVVRSISSVSYLTLNYFVCTALDEGAFSRIPVTK